MRYENGDRYVGGRRMMNGDRYLGRMNGDRYVGGGKRHGSGLHSNRLWN